MKNVLLVLLAIFSLVFIDTPVEAQGWPPINALCVGSGGAGCRALGPAAAGQIIVGQGTGAAPLFRAMSGGCTITSTGVIDCTGTSPGGVAGGDLSGTYPNPVVARIGGIPVGTMATQDANAVAITGGTITGMPTPANPTDVANKAYADSIASGFHPVTASNLATAAALAANTYNNGASGVGATLTGNSNGALTVDGSAVSAGNTILVKNEVAPANNGLYTVTQEGDGSNPYILTRLASFDAPSEMTQGALSFVAGGTINVGSNFALANTVVTVGTTAVVWTLVSSPLGLANGSIFVGNASNIATAHTVSGDCTITNTAVVTCLKTNGTNFTTAATTAIGTSGATIPLMSSTNTWSGAQGFNDDRLQLRGATSGQLTLRAAAIAGSNAIIFPAGTTNFSATGGTSQVVKQVGVGAAFTVGQLSCTDLSTATTACSTAIGTSGATIPLNNGNITLSGNDTLSGNNAFSGTNTYSGDNYFGGGVPWYDITQGAGVHCDGSTDDTAAIQAVIDAASLVGGAVMIPTGQPNLICCIKSAPGLVVKDTTTLPGSYGVRIFGESQSRNSILYACGADNPILTVNRYNTIIQNISLFGATMNAGVPPTSTLLTFGKMASGSKGYNIVASGGGRALDMLTDYVHLEDGSFGSVYGPYIGNIQGTGTLLHNAFDTNWPAITCNGNAILRPGPASIAFPSPWAPTTAYTCGQLVTSQGFVLEVDVAGTSGASPPTLQNLETPIPDGAGTLAWKIVVATNSACVNIDASSASAAGSFSLNMIYNDQTCPAFAGIKMDNTTAGGGPASVYIYYPTIGQTLLYGIDAKKGSDLKVEAGQIGLGAVIGGVGIYQESTWYSTSRYTGNSIKGFSTGIYIAGPPSGAGAVIDHNHIYSRYGVVSGSTTGIFIAANVNNVDIDHNIVPGSASCVNATWDAINSTTISAGAGTGDYLTFVGNQTCNTGVTAGAINIPGVTGTHNTANGFNN